MSWPEIFRAAIRESGKSLRKLADETGIQASQLSYFMRGERGLSIDTAERLASVLGLELVPKSRGGRRGKSRKK